MSALVGLPFNVQVGMKRAVSPARRPYPSLRSIHQKAEKMRRYAIPHGPLILAVLITVTSLSPLLAESNEGIDTSSGEAVAHHLVEQAST